MGWTLLVITTSNHLELFSPTFWYTYNLTYSTGDTFIFQFTPVYHPDRSIFHCSALSSNIINVFFTLLCQLPYNFQEQMRFVRILEIFPQTSCISLYGFLTCQQNSLTLAGFQPCCKRFNISQTTQATQLHLYDFIPEFVLLTYRYQLLTLY